MLKTLIFDCDGVMFQSRGANKAYYNNLLEAFGYPPMNEDELEFVHVHKVADSIAHIFRNHQNTSLEEVRLFCKTTSYTPFLKYMEIEPDLIPFLETTQSRYNLAIATNRTNTMHDLLTTFSLNNYFGKVMTAANSKKTKPAPDPLLEIIAYFNCEITEAVFIGDSTIDEETAKNCGMRFISFRNKALRADLHINNFMELQKHLPSFDR